MCIILFAHREAPGYPLVLAANRDEFHARPTAIAAEWEDDENIIAGRDLLAGGTWLGITKDGRWAAITNHRDPNEFGRDAPSRGALVADYLRGNDDPVSYIRRIAAGANGYNGFNLLLGGSGDVWWYSNRATRPERIEPGVHGLSNALLNTPWPKVERGKEALRQVIRSPTPDSDALLDILLDTTYAAEHEIPDTGLERDLERSLSAPFIITPDYGTRSSTAILISDDGIIDLVERTYTPGTIEFATVRHRVHLER